MDTSLLFQGLIIVHVSHKGGRPGPKCTVSRLEGLDSAALREYREECEMSCYVCRLISQETNSKAMDVISCPGTYTSARPVSVVCPDSIAYVLTTSGTTGDPKLVQVPHCSVVPNILDLRSRFNILPDDVIFNAAPLTFDPSFVEASCFV